MVFLMVIVGSFSSYFRMLGEKWITANKILMVLLSASVVIWPELIIMAPMLAYEIVQDSEET